MAFRTAFRSLSAFGALVGLGAFSLIAIAFGRKTEVPLKREETIRILKQLVAIGFDDEAFWRLHHKRFATDQRLTPIKEAIKAHKDYCAKGGTFEIGGNNHRVY